MVAAGWKTAGRWLLITATVIALLLLATIQWGPVLAARYGEHWFHQQFPDYRLSITDVRYSPRQQRLQVEGITLARRHNADQLTHADTASLRSATGGSTPANANARNIQLPEVSVGQLILNVSHEALLQQQFRGDIIIDQLSVTPYGQPRLQSEQISAFAIEASASQQYIRHLVIKQLSLSDEGQQPPLPLAAVDQYEIKHLRIQPEQQFIQLGEHQFSALSLALDRAADGSILQLQSLLSAHEAAANNSEVETPQTLAASEPLAAPRPQPQQAGDGETVSAQEPVSNQSPLFRITLEGIRQHGERSTLLFSDQSVDPAAAITLAIDKFSLGGFDSQQPEQAMLIDIEAALDDYNRIRAEGQAALVDGHPQGEWLVSLQQLNLVPFNGYLAQAMGYQVRKGSLTVEADIAISNAQLSGESKILLRNSKFVPVDDAAIQRLSKQISMPVDTALSLLRDDNNNIRLTVPLRGDIDNPDVGLEDLASQLGTLAFKQAAGYYLKQALQPYGTFISLSSYVGDYLFAIRLDDLQYQPMTVELNSDQVHYLEKVAEMMRDKTTLELQVCGFASFSEVSRLAETPSDTIKNWQQLATQRAAVIKAWFNSHDAALVERVTTCQPQKGEQAVVSLGF